MAAKDFTGKTVLDAPAIWKIAVAKLATSGLTEKDGHALKMSAMTATESGAAKLWKGGHPALRIPYFDPWNTTVPMINGLDPSGPFYRARCLTDPLPILPPDDKGKPRRFPKYAQAFGSRVRAYFPPTVNWREVLEDTARPIVITEGELKAAAGAKHGFPTIGLGGVWSFMAGKMDYELLPELHVPWELRQVYIAFDSDIAIKPEVQNALSALTARLIKRGALVYRIDLPQPDDLKVGLDDYLLTKGANLKALMKAAPRLEDWQSQYQMSDTGPINNLHNVGVAMRSAPDIKDVFAFDQMQVEPSVIQPLLDDDADTFTRRRWTDHDVSRTQDWLQGYGGLSRIGDNDVRTAIKLRSYQKPFHPVRDYLRSVTWDKKPRLTGWLARYFGVEQNEYTDAMGRMVLIAMVARVEKPGCKCDYMMVLVDPKQGEGKSTALSILASEEYFSDQLPKLDGNDEKRLSSHLNGKWLIEIAELSAMRKAEVEDIKRFITRQTEKYTRMYGKTESIEPRQCVFVGTTNEEKFLKDETGNRRFWPVHSGKIDLSGLRADRDQLFAEAFIMYQAGEKWYPTPDLEARLFNPEQDKYFAGGDWDDFIKEHLNHTYKIVSMDPVRLASFTVTTNSVAEEGLNFEKKSIHSGISNKIATTLKRLGWTEKRSNGTRRFLPPPGFTGYSDDDSTTGSVPPAPSSPKPKSIAKRNADGKKY
jgi:predicted P-loop ATPase